MTSVAVSGAPSVCGWSATSTVHVSPKFSVAALQVSLLMANESGASPERVAGPLITSGAVPWLEMVTVCETGVESMSALPKSIEVGEVVGTW